MRLTLGEALDMDTGNDVPAFGFEHRDMFITDPYVSDCGRFKVDPVTTYDITLHEAGALWIANQALKSAHYKGKL